MKQAEIRKENERITHKDREAREQGFKFKVLWDNGKTEYIKEIPKDESKIKQVLNLELV